MTEETPLRWYLLIHQIPPKPLYLRAKIRRRLARVGAIALKNSVYVLPADDERLEDLQWIAQEIVAGGGEAHVCRADFVDETAGARLVERFRAEREADFESLADELRPLAARLRRRRRPRDTETASALERGRKRFAEIAAADFFGAAGRAIVEDLLRDLESASAPAARRSERAAPRSPGATWVTRRGVHVDRIASAWLVRRFVDPDARFRFVDPKDPPRSGEVRFDMVGGDFSHEGDRCTFETLVSRLGIADPALVPIAEIVHDVDLKDGKFGRGEAAGIERLLHGILLTNPDDAERIDRGSTLFDGLYESFRRRQTPLPADTRDARKKGDRS